MLTLLRNAHVYAPADRGICQLLIGGGRILAISDSKSELHATGASELDIEGRPVVPGFIDGHAHITGGGGESGFASRIPPVPLSRFTTAGVTSVVGLLGTDDTTRSTRSLVATVYALREQGLGAWCYTGGYHIPPTTLTGKVRDDIVFVEPIIGVGEVALSDHRSSQPSLAELLRIASDAHTAGLISAKAGIVHLHMGDGPRGLQLVSHAIESSELPARVFNPTHINRRKALFDEALELAAAGCVVDITAFPPRNDEDHWPADVALVRYLDAGAPVSNITISSDGGGCIPQFNDQGEVVSTEVGTPATLAQTFARLIAAGLPIDRALPAFTTNVAALLRLDGRGAIETGGCADLLVLDGNGTVTDVMIAGHWHVRDGNCKQHGAYE